MSKLDKSKYYTIGQMSRISFLPAETLRYYDRIGLIKPSVIDPDTGYRYYHVDQIWNMDIVSMLRELAMPVNEIKQLLQETDNASLVRALMHQKEKAEELSARYARIAEDIDWYNRQNNMLHSLHISNDIHVEERPERIVVIGEKGHGNADFHMKVDRSLSSAGMKRRSIRRHFGYIPEESNVKQNIFYDLREYVWFEDTDLNEYEPEHLLTIPSGMYAYFYTIVKNTDGVMDLDYSPLLNWMDRHHFRCSRVYCDDMGLQLILSENYKYVLKVAARLEE